MKQDKYIWKKEYTLILIANIVYILAFYLITNHFTV